MSKTTWDCLGKIVSNATEYVGIYMLESNNYCIEKVCQVYE